MKRHGLVIAAVAAAIVTVGSAQPADAPVTSAHHEVRVSVEVVPNIAVTGPLDSIHLGEVIAGEQSRISAVIPFNLKSACPAVMMRVGATHLYRSDDGQSAYALPLCEDDPPEVISSDCKAAGYSDNSLPWDAGAYELRGKSGRVSQARVFTAGKANFRADLRVRVSWSNDDPTLPRGRYTGHVKFIAEVLPNVQAPSSED